MAFELKAPEPAAEPPKPRFTRTRVRGGANEIWVGTYEEGVTKEEIAAALRGPFGGSFDGFGFGRYQYIAYMD